MGTESNSKNTTRLSEEQPGDLWMWEQALVSLPQANLISEKGDWGRWRGLGNKGRLA